jgi:hypothetical protein
VIVLRFEARDADSLQRIQSDTRENLDRIIRSLGNHGV